MNYSKFIKGYLKENRSTTVDLDSTLTEMLISIMNIIEEDKLNSEVSSLIEYLEDSDEVTGDNLYYSFHKSLRQQSIFDTVTDVTLWHILGSNSTAERLMATVFETIARYYQKDIPDEKIDKLVQKVYWDTVEDF